MRSRAAILGWKNRYGMNEEEARELIVALSHNPLSLARVEAKWDPVDNVVIEVEATGGGTITLRDIESGRRLAREIIKHEVHATMRCGIYEEDGTVRQVPPNEWIGRDFGYQRSEKQVQCSPTIKAIKYFCGMTNELDGPPKFWRVNFIDSKTDQQYGGDIAFATSEQVDEFIRRYIEKDCPASDSQEFLELKNEYR